MYRGPFRRPQLVVVSMHVDHKLISPGLLLKKDDEYKKASYFGWQKTKIDKNSFLN